MVRATASRSHQPVHEQASGSWVLCGARHEHLATPIVSTAMAVPPASDRIVSMRRGGSRCREPAPITTAGDRAGVLRTGQGARNAE